MNTIWQSMGILVFFMSCVSHWTSTTELQLLNFRHLLHIGTPVSPLWANALGLKSRHCFERAVEIIHTVLSQILLLGTLLSSYCLLCFPYGNRGEVLPWALSWARSWSPWSNKETSGESFSLQWLKGESWEPVFTRLKLIIMNALLTYSELLKCLNPADFHE